MKRVFLIVALAAAVLGFTPRADTAKPRACNGLNRLCGRSLGDVAFATTHNSMASSANGFRPPN